MNIKVDKGMMVSQGRVLAGVWLRPTKTLMMMKWPILACAEKLQT